jgi:predicted XRE-type DNA-binding protein
MKPVEWLGDSLARLRDFPREAMREAGYQLERVQDGREPKDWKPMNAVGPRVPEEVATHGAARRRIGKQQVQEPGEHESIAMKEKLKRIRGSGNVFLDLGFDKAEAENLKMRAQLMMRIEDFCRQNGRTQAAAAKVLGITQPRLNALLKGKIGQFSLDALVNIANRAGLNVRLVIRKAA